ncbi:MAG: class I SAM-dependent methyltransferase [Clostridiales bacterium]|nr:class I SAM-dependent methyltransferase [Clostridiales bacterium]
MDSTRMFYESNAEEYFNKTYNANMLYEYDRFLNYVAPTGHVMDLGCGSGRDSLFFLQHNYIVDALDSSKKLCELVNKKIGIKPLNCRIQDWKPNIRYDGIWACASLLHLKSDEFETFIRNLQIYLNIHGVLFASVKNGIPTGVCDDGRYYQNYTEASIKNIIDKNPALSLKELWYSQDSFDRDDFRWMNFIVMKVYP